MRFVAMQLPPQYACGCLFLLSGVLKAKPPMWTMALQKESVDDELEHFEDIIEDPANVDYHPSNNSPNSGGIVASKDEEKLVLSNHKEGYNSDSENCLNNISRVKCVTNGNSEAPHEGSAYLLVIIRAIGSLLTVQLVYHETDGHNSRHGEPSYCKEARLSWCELAILASHVHPSVATMARTLLSGVNIVYNGDRLNELSLVAYKFMEKKPKPNKKTEGRWNGGSQIGPARKVQLKSS